MSKSVPAVLLALTLALTGCTMAAPSAPRDQPIVTDTLAPTLEPMQTDVDVIVGTGQFVSATAEVTGGVVVKQRGSTFTLYLTDYSLSDTSHLTLAVSSEAIAVDGCVSDRYELAFDPNGQLQPDGGFPLFVSPSAVDPGYLKTIVIAKYPSGGQVAGVCYEPTVAVAALEWSLTDPFPELGPAEDSGSTSGATGLAWTEGGVVLRYKTAPGDTFDAIAARFGLTAAELMYLNPERPMHYDDGVAYADEVLVLSRDAR